MAMTIKQIYELVIRMGIAADPRGRAGVKKWLEYQKEKYDGLKGDDKKFFDKVRLENPYSDSKFLVGDEKREVKRVMIGVDIDSAEILLAKEMERMGKSIDLVISHHPEGSALLDLENMIDIQTHLFEREGVPIHVAEKVISKRKGEVGRILKGMNRFNAVDAAKIIGQALLSVHTPADNIGMKFVQSLVNRRRPERLKNLLEVLKEIPEYQVGRKNNIEPVIYAGDPDSRTGRVLVEFTGGVSSPIEVYKELSKAGVSTLIEMYISEQGLKNAAKANMNVIVLGHVASDSIGLNHIADELEKKGIEVVPVHGFFRYSRVKKSVQRVRRGGRRK